MTKLTNDQVEDIFLNYADESVNDELHISLYAFKEAINKAFSLNGVVASLPTTNEAKLKLKQSVQNIFKDNEIVEKRQYSLGFRHCYNWLKIEQIKSKG